MLACGVISDDSILHFLGQYAPLGSNHCGTVELQGIWTIVNALLHR